MKVNKVYNEDVFAFLKRVDNESVDLIVADPPYGISIEKWDEFGSHEDFMNFTKRWIDMAVHKLKKTGSIYIFNTAHHSAYILQYLDSIGLKFQNWITWDKRDGFSYTTKHYLNRQETCLFYTKSDEYHFEHQRIPYNPNDPYDRRMLDGMNEKHMKLLMVRGNRRMRWRPNQNGKIVTNVWHIPSERTQGKYKINGKTQRFPHINVKPLKMVEIIVKSSSMEGDLVLDPFMGSGTTAVACTNNNRNYIGCEQSSEYCDLIKKRVKEAMSKPDIRKYTA